MTTQRVEIMNTDQSIKCLITKKMTGDALGDGKWKKKKKNQKTTERKGESKEGLFSR